MAQNTQDPHPVRGTLLHRMAQPTQPTQARTHTSQVHGTSPSTIITTIRWSRRMGSGWCGVTTHTARQATHSSRAHTEATHYAPSTRQNMVVLSGASEMTTS
jgi:hypothetical protein